MLLFVCWKAWRIIYFRPSFTISHGELISAKDRDLEFFSNPHVHIFITTYVIEWRIYRYKTHTPLAVPFEYPKHAD